VIGLALLFGMTLFVAYSNGSNDNFKGVVTLFGCKAATYRAAITLATCTTFVGSVYSVLFLAAELIAVFSEKGLVPDAVLASSSFLLAVAAVAAVTVILTTLKGFPISTTHGLTGAFPGVGLINRTADRRVIDGILLSWLFTLPMAAVIAGDAYIVIRDLA